eukprot:gene16946-8440_t
MSPQGTIVYISKAYGGRTSDKFLTEDCGILRNLLPEDILMANRGFDIEEVTHISAYMADDVMKRLEQRSEDFEYLIASKGPHRITFVVDETGNIGKTFLAKYILATKSFLYFMSTLLMPGT